MSYPDPSRYGYGYNAPPNVNGAYRQQQPPNGAYMQQTPVPAPGAYPQGAVNVQQYGSLPAPNQAAYYSNSRQAVPHQYQHTVPAWSGQTQPDPYQSSPVLPPIQSYSQPPPVQQYQQPQQQYRLPPVRQFQWFDGSSDEPTSPQQPMPKPIPPQPAPHHAVYTPPPQPKQQPKQEQRTPSQARPNVAPIDAHTLLPSLAEEYFIGAHYLGFSTVQRTDTSTLKQYQKLIATGLACLEAALSTGKLEPRMEALVRLRYAAVLLEETENTMEAETALSKGITLCEQNRFFDLKYTMQVLLAKLMFKRSPKAAMIALDTNISEVEAYQHHSWVYVFRFLRATLSLQTGRSSDVHASIHNLQAISKLASRRSDHAVVTLAALVEALAYLRTPSAESTENLNRALATAQSYQLSPECNIAPLQVFSHMLRLSSSLSQDPSDKTFEKLKSFQLKINEAAADETWRMRSDAMSIPLNQGNGDARIGGPDTKGLLNVSEDGKESLVFSFLSKQDAYLLGYLLAGAARIHVKCDDVTPIKYLRDGLAKCLDARTFKQSAPVTVLQDIIRKRRIMACYFYCFIAFRSIFTTDWKSAKEALDGLQLVLGDLGRDAERTLTLLFIHLSAMYLQGTGKLSEAAKLYKDERLALPHTNSPLSNPEDQVQRDIAIVAAMNSLLIQTSNENCDIAANTALVDRLSQFCTTHTNVDIQTAYFIVRTVIKTDPPTSQIATKTYMRSALGGAKKRGNFHLVCITLNVMCVRFFSNIIGEQAFKSAMAAKEQSAKSGNKLWMSAATGSLAGTFEIEGKDEEARRTRTEAVRLANVALQGPA